MDKIVLGLRLLGIGRNEYLELVAKSRSLGRRGRSKAIRGLLPRVPLNIPMQPWWRVELGYVLEADVKVSWLAVVDNLPFTAIVNEMEIVFF